MALPMTAVELVLAIGWALFWIYWLASAMSSKRAVVRSSQHIVIRLLILVLVVVLLRSNAFNARTSVVTNVELRSAGLALFVAGLAVAVWARIHLGRNWGVPMSENADPELVTSGPYRYIRHPIYSGIILAMLGTAMAVGIVWLIIAVLLGGYFVYSATVEEKTMMRLFPAAYPPYRRSTRMLVPFIL